MFAPKLRFKAEDGKAFPDWVKHALADLGKIVGGGTPDTAITAYWNGTINWFTPTELKSKYIINSARKISQLGFKNSSAKLLPKGTVLLSTRANVGDVSIALCECTTNQGFQSIIVNENNNIEFAYYLLNFLKRALLRKASGSTFLEISKDEVSKIRIFLPLKNEQQKIAAFLTAVDHRINLMRQKQTLLQQYKKGFMQRIFNQKIRFRRDNGEAFEDWDVKQLAYYWEERSERANADLELLSVTLGQGVIKREDIEDKDNSSADKSNYKTVYPNDMAYNSMRMWQGASGVSRFKGIVSPAYTVLKPKTECHSEFFGHFFKYSPTIHFFERYSQGLTSDTWNLKYPAFSKLKFILPSKPEQQKIAAFLSAIDAKLEILETQIDQAKAFKKGLLQQMFV